MTEPIIQRQQRLEGLHKLITEKGEVSVKAVKEAIRKKWGLSERVISEYISCLGVKPGIKVEDGIFKARK
jgi:hypothetical protein